MRILNVLILIFFINSYSQEKLRVDEIYTIDGLTYKSFDGELFTGIAQKNRNNNHLKYEVEFEKGVLVKQTVYFNTRENQIAREIFYKNKKWNKPLKEISYGLDRDYKCVKSFNSNDEKILDEDYENGILVYRCEFMKNKKNGIEFSVNKNGIKTECKYENGKFLK
ncbi:hypothetical protein [Flavobacterium sp.]|uniref:hypothetical protein n=1 Tax=Flavobacterium sp. TaxID=239 RepID=UPI0025BD071F|nr:hypothetical protein [Flavobacterium sp.]MBA4277729.1 hypothetical protein [Flavobacterium sp.]